MAATEFLIEVACVAGFMSIFAVILLAILAACHLVVYLYERFNKTKTALKNAHDEMVDMEEYKLDLMDEISDLRYELDQIKSQRAQEMFRQIERDG